MKKQIFLIHWGAQNGPKYINRLYGEADPQGITTKHHFEQRFVTQNEPAGVTFFPRQWITHFRRHCIPPFPLNYFLEPRRPSKAKVVIFPGGLNQGLAIEGRLAHHKELSGSGLHHIEKTLGGSKRTKKTMLTHLRHSLRPSPWVNTEWCE